MKHIIPIPFLAVLLACGEAPHAREAGPQPAPVQVQAVAVATADWANTYEATGTVRARTAAALSSKVMGYVREVRVQAGDRVRAGQLLVVLDARDVEANSRRAQAGYEEARGAGPELENSVAAAKASLDLAEATFRRMQDLYSKKSISDQEFDEATARVKAARAAHEMAMARRAQLTARIAQADEERRLSDVMRSYTRIEAPFAGLITVRSVEPGALATPGAPLLTVEREGSYRLEVSVEESRLPLIRVGQPVSVSLDALGRSMEARVSEIIPSVDAAARAYVVKIDLPAAPLVRSGLFGRAAFQLGTRKARSVPVAAVVERGQLQSVMVVEEGMVRTRLVTLGERRASAVEVLSGLADGEKVVAPLPSSLADGARVEVRP